MKLIRAVMFVGVGGAYAVSSQSPPHAEWIMAAINEVTRHTPTARTIGIVYLLYFATAVLGALLARGIVVSGDPAATATNIVAHQHLYRAGFALDLIANALYIALTACFYEFFRPVDRTLSLIAAFSSLAGCAVQIMNELLRIAPLVILGNPRLAALFGREQLQAAAMLSLTLNAEAIRIAVLLFAVFDLTIGYLILRSTYVPSVLGYFMAVAGIAWLTIVWPPLAIALRPIILPVGALAEFSLMVWLLVKGRVETNEGPAPVSVTERSISDH